MSWLLLLSAWLAGLFLAYALVAVNPPDDL